MPPRRWAALTRPRSARSRSRSAAARRRPPGRRRCCGRSPGRRRPPPRLAALVGALVLASRLRVRGRALAAALAVGALAVLVGAASATPGDAARADTAPRTPRATWPAATPSEDGRDGGDGRTRPAATTTDERPRASTTATTAADTPGGRRRRRRRTAPPRRSRVLPRARRAPLRSRVALLSPGVRASFGGLATRGAPASPRRGRAARTA